jgi:WD40 repeat protein/DNA-binding SARP family transcriptional activator/energy-coupling factor transporter ATP-binding protein EcfA2
MEIRLLGPVELELGDRPATLGGPKQRAVLSLLALTANTTVSVDRLIEGLWGEDQPASAAKMVQLYVSQLRKLLRENGGAEIVTHGRGYELRLDPDAVDAARFERLIAEASRGRDNGGATEAAHRALALWRGPPLADLIDEPFAMAEARRLEELRLAALELAIESDLDAGRHREVSGRLDSLVAEHPLRERLHGLRMLALYRAGRQAEALEAYGAARAALVEQVGAEPGPDLRRLHAAILRQDPALELAAPELPPELTPEPPVLGGRAAEHERLRSAWRAARAGAGRVLLVYGRGGVGKTRLVAELAREVQAERASVVYVGGAGPAAGTTLREARRTVGPALIVFDDLDRAPAEIVEGAGEVAGAARASLLIVLAYCDDPPSATVSHLARELEARGAERFPLGPLGPDGVREIVAMYAGERAASAPLERLTEASEGLPRRVHEVVAEWAGREAVQRVGAQAGRAAVRRGELHDLEAELASNVVDLHTVREKAERYSRARRQRPDGGDDGGLPVCPFKGLASYEVSDADYFSGRDQLIAEMVARLAGAGLLGVVGPSGSGKSSAVRAGLLPALAGGVLPGSERWQLALLRPGEHPLRALEHATAESAPQGGLVVAVDQFEEVFTACDDESERAAFVDALVAWARDPRRRAVVLVAVRADFYGRCAAYPELSRLLGANHVLVGPMRRDELRRAIELPARRAGLRVEPELVEALVDDVDGAPGALPLLSTSLLELWQQRDGRRLQMSAYQRAGGVHAAVARLAESAYKRLDRERREVARRMLLRLAGDGDGDTVVRRRVPLAELEAERDEGVAEVLAVLAADRLVTIGEGEVEVAHEALLREWPRLRGWLEEDSEGRRLHRHLIHAAGEWQGSGRDPAELYRGARLASSLDWAAEHDSELNELERQFLDESRSASERDAERQHRVNRRLRSLLAGVGVLLAAAVVAGVIAISERQSAREAATVADAERLGAEALNEERLDQALRLANAGVALDESVATRSNLLSTLLRSPAAIGVLSGDGDPIRSGALSPNGGTLAIGDDDGTVTLFDTETREPIGDHQAPGVVWSLAFDPRTNSLAIAGSTSPDLLSGYVEILDADTARLRSSISLHRHPAGAGLAFFETANYSPDGRSLIVTYSGGDLDRTTGTFMRRFDAREATPQGRAVRVAPRSTSTAPMSSPDGRLLFSSDNATYAVDAETLRVDRRYPVGALTTGLSADGSTLAVEDVDGSLRLLDLASGRLRTLAGAAAGVRRSRLIGEDASFGIGAFSPDGRTLATWDDSENVILWDVREGLPTETFEGHTREAWTQVFSPDGRTLYTAGDDSKVIIWDVAGDRRLGRPFQTGFVYERGELFPPPFAISPDGRTVAVARLDGRVDLIDAETLRRTGGFEAFADRSVVAIDYAPDGRTLAVAGGGGGVGVWDAGSGRRVGPLLRAPRGPVENNPHNVQGMAFGPRGLLAAAEVGGTVRTWDLGRRELAGPTLRLVPFALGLAFSPDGSRLAIPFGALSAEGGDGVEVRDVRSGERLARLPVDSEVRAVAFSPDGRLLAGGQVDGAAPLWATDGWQRVGAPLALREAAALAVAFSPDSRTLVTSHADGAVVLRDVGSRQPIGSPIALPGSPREVYTTADFSPDGRRMFAVHEDGRAFRWEVDPDAWTRHACRVAGGLTPEQWSEVVPEQDYVSACPSG